MVRSTTAWHYLGSTLGNATIFNISNIALSCQSLYRFKLFFWRKMTQLENRGGMSNSGISTPKQNNHEFLHCKEKGTERTCRHFFSLFWCFTESHLLDAGKAASDGFLNADRPASEYFLKFGGPPSDVFLKDMGPASEVFLKVGFLIEVWRPLVSEI